MSGSCQKSEEECQFSHDREDAPLCLSWTKGQCEECSKRHFYIESDSGNLSEVKAEKVKVRGRIVLKEATAAITIQRKVSTTKQVTSILFDSFKFMIHEFRLKQLTLKPELF